MHHRLRTLVGGAVTFGAISLISTSRVDAQTGDPYVDSAAVARAAYRAAGLAPTLRESVIALMRAARAWPTQPAYWIAAGRLGARLSDSMVVAESLEALTRLGAGASIMADSAVQRAMQQPLVASRARQLERATANINAGIPIVTLSDSNVYAEGVDADARTGNFYVASIRQRTIYEITPAGRVRDLAVARAGSTAQPRVGALLGVRVANDGQSLYATTAGLPAMRDFQAVDSTIAAIIRVRIADGVVIGRWDVPRDGAAHLLGDLAIDNAGTVYASDSFSPTIWVLTPGRDSLTTIRHPLFRSLQGIAPVPGTATLIVADYSHGLLRVNTHSHDVLRIADTKNSSSLGIDGIIWHDGTIIGVQNGVDPARIVRFGLDKSHTRIERATVIDRQPAIADEPTIGTLWRGNFVYVANSQWEKYDDAGHRRPGTTVRPTQLLCIALTPYAAVAATPGVSATSATKARNGTRSTASAPPLSRSCSTSEAASP